MEKSRPKKIRSGTSLKLYDDQGLYGSIVAMPSRFSKHPTRMLAKAPTFVGVFWATHAWRLPVQYRLHIVRCLFNRLPAYSHPKAAKHGIR